jgi:hypothetical protein
MRKKLFIEMSVEMLVDIPDEITEVEDQYDYVNENYVANTEIIDAIQNTNYTIDDVWMVSLKNA